ncbi:hypothetical protein FB451DRAFT_1168233 [Mycena latifolia]|nr:hypothetical protein FB451DRAFT_1168233 [Mycena latifolia]
MTGVAIWFPPGTIALGTYVFLTLVVEIMRLKLNRLSKQGIARIMKRIVEEQSKVVYHRPSNWSVPVLGLQIRNEGESGVINEMRLVDVAVEPSSSSLTWKFNLNSRNASQRVEPEMTSAIYQKFELAAQLASR